MIKILAWWRRFFSNLQKPKEQRQLANRLTFSELSSSKTFILKTIQALYLNAELTCLKNNKPLPSNSKIKNLNPYLDNDLIKVGGRIQNADVPEQTKHPIILPKCHTTETIISDIHHQMLHAGTQLTLNQVNTEYWIIKAKSIVKKIINRCMYCAKLKTQTFNQLMGSLPEPRITIAPPFSRSGIDYAGPIITRRNKGRGNINEKSYIAVFVCLVTKAMHLEAVTDLTSDTFIAALKRS
ncbi:uncharacterized protein DMENIID0001_161440 [Sergentomyia squamirostris]